jgi:hypothetical protein
VEATRLLLAIPVLLALAIASLSPAAPTAVTPAAPTTAPPTTPAAPPAARPPGQKPDDDCACPQQLLWEECEPAWHHDGQPDDRPRRLPRRPAPGSQDGPV